MSINRDVFSSLVLVCSGRSADTRRMRVQMLSLLGSQDILAAFCTV